MEIRPAAPGEARLLTEVAWAAKAHWGYPAAWMEAWRGELAVTAGYVERQVVKGAWEGGEILGFYALEPAGAVGRLEHLWVRPEAMGRGVGRQLLGDAVAEARRRGCRALEIASDPNGEGFYLRMGARRVGEVAAPVPGGEGRTLPLLSLAVDA